MSNNILEMIVEAAKKFPTQVAFRCHEVDLSYAETLELSSGLAVYLKNKFNLKPQDKVAIMLPNLLQNPVCIFAVLLAGAVVVNLNPLDKAPSLIHQLKLSKAKVVIVLENFVDQLNIVVQDKEVKQNLAGVIISSVGDLYPFWKKSLYNFVNRYIKFQVGAIKIDNYIKLADALGVENQVKDQIKGDLNNKLNLDIKAKPQDLAFIQFTGGTTGDPKAVMLTHANIMANLDQCYCWIQDILSDNQQVLVTPLPLYHIFALVANLLLFFKVGGLNVLIPNPKDLDSFIKTIKGLKFNVISGVNTLYLHLLRHPKFKDCDFSELRVAIAGGMGLDKHVAHHWHQVTNNYLTQGYGLTETSPVLTICPLNEQFNGSVGKAVKNTQIAIFDEQDNKLSVSNSKSSSKYKYKLKGEICVKGPQVMLGYLDNSKATKSVFNKDGYLKTGDYGYIDDQDYIYVLDRLKDIIIVSGFNVCASEVEQVILQMPQVSEVAIIGEDDLEHGEKVVAHVVLADGVLDNIEKNKNKREGAYNKIEQQIIKYAHAKLAAYKSPTKVVFHDSLPKSNLGKILKKDLL